VPASPRSDGWAECSRLHIQCTCHGEHSVQITSQLCISRSILLRFAQTLSLVSFRETKIPKSRSAPLLSPVTPPIHSWCGTLNLQRDSCFGSLSGQYYLVTSFLTHLQRINTVRAYVIMAHCWPPTRVGSKRGDEDVRVSSHKAFS
jgi:hypothetical protein